MPACKSYGYVAKACNGLNMHADRESQCSNKRTTPQGIQHHSVTPVTTTAGADTPEAQGGLECLRPSVHSRVHKSGRNCMADHLGD